MKNLLQRLWDWVCRLYDWLNKILRGAPACIAAAVNSFNRVRAGQAAASIAYYALFSLFPLLLLFIAGGSSVLERDQVEQLVIRYIGQALPVSTDVLAENIDRALDARGPIGIAGFAGLLWAALGVFSALAININLAWSYARERNFFMRRLIGLLMIFLLVVLLLASLVLNGLIQLLIAFRGQWNITVSVYEANFWKLFSFSISLALVFLMFLAMYKFVPTTRSSWRQAFWGALAATLLSYLAGRLFAWYLNVGLANYELVYGSLGTIVALMFFIYILATITLFGAHLAAATARDPESTVPEEAPCDEETEPAALNHDPAIPEPIANTRESK
jgi:membrane protein